ncbi:hypothetical protein A9Q84_09125 [Halobacteriovorax marinus]|uniref:L,D-TPase catalytic domain-containing protein n=1 Tax=Halobacteriovorax marinus TaxID=97084 RepID=A0A1Y5FCC6_9BACT|nr:hypothetical protein A9Q84_09125 [Halobacteriovorax marinus]
MKSIILIITFLLSFSSLAQVTRINIHKGRRTLELVDHKRRVIKTFDIMLGRSPLGTKIKRGDNKTPEGIYKVDWRNSKSKYRLSLHINYPNKLDLKRSRALGVDPGDNIFIHGMPTHLGTISDIFNSLGIESGTDMVNYALSFMDWTRGCIALSNSDIEEVWKLTPNGAQVVIYP